MTVVFGRVCLLPRGDPRAAWNLDSAFSLLSLENSLLPSKTSLGGQVTPQHSAQFLFVSSQRTLICPRSLGLLSDSDSLQEATCPCPVCPGPSCPAGRAVPTWKTYPCSGVLWLGSQSQSVLWTECSCHFHKPLGGLYFCCPHFTAEETDAWRESVIIQALIGSIGVLRKEFYFIAVSAFTYHGASQPWHC